MPAYSMALALGAEQHQVAVASASPSVGVVQVRIADGVSHEEVKRLLLLMINYARANLVSG